MAQDNLGGGRKNYSENATVQQELSKRKSEEHLKFLLPYLRPWDTLLVDLGCGLGKMSMGLATYCKHVVGVDIDEGLIKKAKCALRDAYISNVTFIQGDCRETLDVKPESQDVVLMHALAYHQSAPDLKNMLAEAMRILKPGGIVALRDSDAGGDLIEPMTAEIEFALSVSRAWNKHEDHHLYFGRTQRRVLSESGFVDVHISASYENFARTLEDARNHGQTLKEVYESFRPLITKDEADRAINAWLGWSRSPDAVFFRCRCEAIGHKPLQ